MKTSNLGYPRIGEKREWKKALEQFWAGNLDETTFIDTVENIRLNNLQKQKDSGIDLIPVNDFTYYDHVLDTAIMFGLIPERYLNEENESSLSTYFAMARGNNTAVAGEMTKWFNTNYHYIIPEFEGQKLTLTENKPLNAYLQAKEKLGINGKPVVLGPYTFIKLSKGYTDKQLPAIFLQLVPLYVQLLKELEQAGVEWVQIDEPILVTDLTSAELETISYIYGQLQEGLSSLNIMLQTYFDAVEHYEQVINLPVQGIGLDFVHGRAKNIENIAKFGFPEDKVLAAGIIDGRNIWRSNCYEKKSIVDSLLQKVTSDRIWLQPSCSLLHVPITTENERLLEDTLKNALAFADQKLSELTTIATSFTCTSERVKEIFLESEQALLVLNQSEDRNIVAVQEEMNNLHEDDFTRSIPFAVRKGIQQDYWQLPVLPTTTIGSFPQSAEVRKMRRLFKNGQLVASEYKAYIEEQIKKWIGIQETLELDVFVHGEFERNDMVEYFGEKLAGFAFSENAWVQSYGSRCVKPPIIFGDVAFIEPMTVNESVYAQSLTDKPVKGMLTGPVTILNWSFVRDDISRKQVCYQIALALRKEVESLEFHGIKMIQVDEPALREGLPLKQADWNEYLQWSVKAFKLSTSSVSGTTQIHTHMCYCDFNNFMDTISELDADIISIETSRSHGDLLLSSQLKSYEKGIGLGVYDIHSPRVPNVEEMEQLLIQYMMTIDEEQIWVNPDCGLKTRKENETVLALKNMVEATKNVREKIMILNQTF